MKRSRCCRQVSGSSGNSSTRRGAAWLIVLAFVTSPLHVFGQAPGTTSALHAQLIEQLGAAKFQTREQATAELLSQGERVLPLLRSVAASAPYEVRHRAGLIAQQIEDDKFLALSNSFLLDLDAEKSYGLPSWNRYRQLVGSSRTSKLLFLDMIRQQPEVARLIELAGPAAPSVKQTAADAVQPTATQSSAGGKPVAGSAAALRALETIASMEAVRLREDLFSYRETKLGDAVAMLMVAATLPTQTPVEISDIISISERRSFEGSIHKDGYKNCLRKLLAAWLPKTHIAMAPAAMTCALEHDLAEGASIARRCLTANFDNDTRTLAFYCLARFGDETDVSPLAAWLDDRTVVEEFARSAIEGRRSDSDDSGFHESDSAPPGALPGVLPQTPRPNNFVVRISDLALVTSMVLLGENPQSIYPRFEEHSKSGFFIHSLAGPAEATAEQQQLIQQWKQQHLALRSES